MPASKKSTPSIQYLDTQPKLQQFCDAIHGADHIAIDTEFERRNTYRAKLCLVQVSAHDEDGEQQVGLIDTLKLSTQQLAPLKNLLANDAVKILHAASQDLEIFHQVFDTIPTPLFDTQLAAAVLGYGEQLGYGGLVKDIFNVSLNKVSRFTDWTQRPLGETELDYAAADVIYLLQLYPILLEQLREKGREQWIAEETTRLTDPATYTPVSQQAWQRLKIKDSDARFRGRVRVLAAWREEQAMARNKARTRILTDEQLLRLAAVPPKRLPKQPLPDKALLPLLQQATPLPAPPRQAPAKDAAAMPLLRLLLVSCAKQHQVAERLIATVPDLEDLTRHGAEATTPALQGWRREVFGEAALQLLAGEVVVRYDAVEKRVVVGEP